jgi:hypothetical protein
VTGLWGRLVVDTGTDRGTRITIWFGVVSVAIGIFGILFGLYTYRASQPVASVGYVALREPIARLQGSDFSLSVDGQALSSRSLYRSTVGIWNAGTVPLEKVNVRRPLTVEFTPPRTNRSRGD